MMTIEEKTVYIVEGKGHGNTQISSFDAALHNAGISDYNLVYLSSIIPIGHFIKNIKSLNNLNARPALGDKIYIVISKKYQSEKGKKACAAIGWAQRKDKSGIFVEHSGENKNDVRAVIKTAIMDMVKYRRGNFSKIKIAQKECICRNKCLCVLVAAVFL